MDLFTKLMSKDQKKNYIENFNDKIKNDCKA